MKINLAPDADFLIQAIGDRYDSVSYIYPRSEKAIESLSQIKDGMPIDMKEYVFLEPQPRIVIYWRHRKPFENLEAIAQSLEEAGFTVERSIRRSPHSGDFEAVEHFG